MRLIQRAVAVWLSVALTGCATTVPYTGVGPYPQLERGAPVPPIDFLGNVFALPAKLLFWDWRFANHVISEPTEQVLIAYLEARDLPVIEDARFRLNQYRPLNDVARLVKNRHVAWPYRLLIGLPVTLVGDVLLPGRLFPWGDYYNPYTNTVHLYSDHPAISLHEAGHVQDLASRRRKGTYATLRLIPFVDLYQESKATQEAVRYLQETQDRSGELAAYKILYPAYGSYVGSYLFPPLGTLIGVLLGHAAGRGKAAIERPHDTHPVVEPAAAPVPAEPAVAAP